MLSSSLQHTLQFISHSFCEVWRVLYYFEIIWNTQWKYGRNTCFMASLRSSYTSFVFFGIFCWNRNHFNTFICLCVLIMSYTRFRVDLHSLVCLNVKELLAQNRHDSWGLCDCNGIWHYKRTLESEHSNHFAKLAFFKMIEPCCEYLPECWVWLCVLTMLHMSFRVTLNSVFTWMSRNPLLKTGAISEVQVTTAGLEPTIT